MKINWQDRRGLGTREEQEMKELNHLLWRESDNNWRVKCGMKPIKFTEGEERSLAYLQKKYLGE